MIYKKIKKNIRKIFNKKRTNSIIQNIFNYRFSLEEKYVYDLLILSHGMEKELCVKGAVAKNGQIEKLIKELCYLLDNNYDVSAFEIRECYSILELVCSENDLQKYLIELHSIKNKYKIKKIRNIGLKRLGDISSNLSNIEFLKNRHSIRWFQNELISEGEIIDIINTAKNVPSSCNRQPCKVVYSRTKEGNDLIKKYVPDRLVSRNIYNFMVVICDCALFSHAEKSQSFINSGIFIESLLLSIHAHNFGGSAFQCPIALNKKTEFRNMLKVKESEIVMAFVGYGVIDTSKKILCAEKRKFEEIAIPLDK